MSNLKDALHIPDTQSERDERHLAIQRVGIKDVRYPLQLRVADSRSLRHAFDDGLVDEFPDEQPTVAFSGEPPAVEERPADFPALPAEPAAWDVEEAAAAAVTPLPEPIAAPLFEPAPPPVKDLPPLTGAVERIVVLGRARVAHREVGHGGGEPVVGQAGDDGVPRTAVGACDERVAEPAIGRVAKFAQTVRTDRDVGRNERAGARVPGTAGHDLERGGTAWRHRVHGDVIDAGHRWRIGAHGRHGRVDGTRRAFEFTMHRAGVVENQAGHAVARSHPGDGGPKTDTLNDADDIHAHPHRGGRAR